MELEGIRQKLDQSLVPEAGEKEEDCAITPAEKAAVKKLHRGIGHPQKAEMVNRPAAIPRSYQPNKVIGVDLIYIPEVGGNGAFPALSALDWGTNYQMVQRVPNKEPSEVWDVFSSMWMRTFGAPEVLITDPGREFLAQFLQAAASHRIVAYQTAAKAPWQQGRTERHGHHYKQMLEKARSEVVVTSATELRQLMEEVEQAKNRYSNRSGFSPIQRQIGQWPRLPTNLLSDEALDPTLVAGALTDDIERLHHMRTIAHKAFVEVNSQEAIKKVLRGRPRVWQEFEAGEYVYVYRVPRPRKKKHGSSEVLEIARNPHRAGYKDISMEEWPPTDDEDGGEEPPSRRGCRWHGELKKKLTRRRSPGGGESRPGSVVEQEPLIEDMEEHQYRDAVTRSRERADRLDDHGPVRSRDRGGVGHQSHPYTHWSEVTVLFQSVEEAAEDEEEEQKKKVKELIQEAVQGAKKDYWEVDWRSGTLKRVHQKKRRQKFKPDRLEGLPWRVEDLEATRRTVKQRLGGAEFFQVEEDAWVEERPQPKVEKSSWWKGYTEFVVKEEAWTEENRQRIAAFVGEKKGQDEVDPRREDEEGQKAWKVADRSEWDKVVGSGAVEVMSLAESRKIREELKKDGKESRILPTKVARRYKPAEPPGQPPTRKSRLCLRGDLDPDILELERFSPTINTMNFNLLLQLAANSSMSAAVADFSNAFCQSKPLEREKGPLFFAPPAGGVDGLHQEQIVKIINGVYGLVDAPLHWRKSLLEELQKLGYQSSKLDPCIWKLHDPSSGELCGAVAIEVDDLFMVGHEAHWKQMEKLKSKYKFGKWVKLQEEEDGCSFNGRRIRQLKDAEFRVDMEKFINERLQPVSLEKGRLSQKKEKATEKEVSLARTTCGALNWLSKEGRPDAAGPSSLLASKLNNLYIEDIALMNEAVKNLKENARLFLRIQPIKRMKLETQALSRGLGDLLWAMVTMEEFKSNRFEIQKWPERLSATDALALSSWKTQEVLRSALAVVDAKSLFDYLSKDTVGGQDKRTAIEIQIIRDDLRSIGGQVRWVDHMSMIADGLTKIRGSNAALYEVVKSGRFRIKAEEVSMEARSQARADGVSNAVLRRTGIKEKGEGIPVLLTDAMIHFRTNSYSPDWDAPSHRSQSITPAVRDQATSFCDSIKARPDGWRLCWDRFAQTESLEVKFWCLQVILQSMLSLPAEARLELRGKVVSWLRDVGANKQEEVVVKNKLALVYAGLVRLDYPQNWPSAWQELMSLMEKGCAGRSGGKAPLVDFFLRVLAIFDQEVMSDEVQRSNEDRQRSHQIKHAMRERDVVSLVECWYRILTTLGTSAPQVVSDCLKVLSLYIVWIEILTVANDKFLSAVCNLIATASPSANEACECLAAVVSKKMPASKKVQGVEMYYT
eukprot:symbB.v1.2.025243.t2/scaffold2441.1/size78965/1